MKLSKENTHAFIVRIWMEHRDMKAEKTIWRGVIINVESDQQVYFDHLDTMRDYFAKYLEDIGINVD